MAHQHSGQLVKSETRDLSAHAVVEQNTSREAALGFSRVEDWILHTRSVQAQKSDEGAKIGTCHCPSRFRGLLG